MGWYKDGTPEGKERLFYEVLNMGNGVRSLHKRNVLIHRVEEAFDALGTTQQPNMSTNAPEGLEDKEVRERLRAFIEGIVEDVAVTLTGKEWGPKE